MTREEIQKRVYTLTTGLYEQIDKQPKNIWLETARQFEATEKAKKLYSNESCEYAEELINAFCEGAKWADNNPTNNIDF